MTTMITAHAGADGLPDNSLAYVRHALASAADALEVDVRRAPDGTLRLGHDSADRRLPTLGAVFALLTETPSLHVNCDLKEPGLQEDVCALARDYGLAGQLILTGTTDAAAWAASPQARETAELWLNPELLLPDFYEKAEDPAYRRRAAEELCSFCERNGLTTVNIHYRLAETELASRLSQAGVALSVWTVNEPEDIRRLLAAGVRNLTTRKLSEALAIKKRAVRMGSYARL